MNLEIAKAIESLPNNKAPGPDGFVAEYYKQFTPILMDHLAVQCCCALFLLSRRHVENLNNNPTKAWKITQLFPKRLAHLST